MRLFHGDSNYRNAVRSQKSTPSQKGSSVRTLTVARHIASPRPKRRFELIPLSRLQQREIDNISHGLRREQHVHKSLPKAGDVAARAFLASF